MFPDVRLVSWSPRPLRVWALQVAASLKTAEVPQLPFFDKVAAHCRDELTGGFFRACAHGQGVMSTGTRPSIIRCTCFALSTEISFIDTVRTTTTTPPTAIQNIITSAAIVDDRKCQGASSHCSCVSLQFN